MITNRYIPSISGLLAIILITHVVIPAISNCLFLADCDVMMEMNYQPHNDMDTASMNMMNHSNSKMSTDHCDMMDISPLYTAESHSLAECHCIESDQIHDGLIVLSTKTSITVLERDLFDFELSSLEIKSLHILVDDFKPDPSPPDLFISYEALLI